MQIFYYNFENSNHFLDRLTKFPDGLTVSKKDFKSLLSKIGSEVTMGQKLLPMHLEVKGLDRQNVKTACELLSNTVAELFRYFFGEKKALSDFIDLADKSFNIMCSKYSEHPDFSRSAFGGQNFDNQLTTLKEFQDLVSKTQFYGAPRFNMGIIGAITAIIQLQSTIQNDFNVTTLLTSHTTQGCGCVLQF